MTERNNSYKEWAIFGGALTFGSAGATFYDRLVNHNDGRPTIGLALGAGALTLASLYADYRDSRPGPDEAGQFNPDEIYTQSIAMPDIGSDEWKFDTRRSRILNTED